MEQRLTPQEVAEKFLSATLTDTKFYAMALVHLYPASDPQIAAVLKMPDLTPSKEGVLLQALWRRARSQKNPVVLRPGSELVSLFERRFSEIPDKCSVNHQLSLARGIENGYMHQMPFQVKRVHVYFTSY
jgi:ribosomal protein L34E